MKVCAAGGFSFFVIHIRKEERMIVTLLAVDELGDAVYFGRLDEGALHAGDVDARICYEHVAAADKPVCARLVENGLRVY